MSNCANCFHPKENHKPVEGSEGKYHICTGSLECRCEHYEEPYLVQFAQDIEKQKLICRGLQNRSGYILENIPQTRNAGEKAFAKIYREIWHGIKIRKNAEDSTTVTTEVHKRLPHDDSINREKRRCKQWNADLRTYDPKIIKKQAAIWEAYMELAIEA